VSSLVQLIRNTYKKMSRQLKKVWLSNYHW
jgi:hypothetical protein